MPAAIRPLHHPARDNTLRVSSNSSVTTVTFKGLLVNPSARSILLRCTFAAPVCHPSAIGLAREQLRRVRVRKVPTNGGRHGCVAPAAGVSPIAHLIPASQRCPLPQRRIWTESRSSSIYCKGLSTSPGASAPLLPRRRHRERKAAPIFLRVRQA